MVEKKKHHFWSRVKEEDHSKSTSVCFPPALKKRMDDAVEKDLLRFGNRSGLVRIAVNELLKTLEKERNEET